jgi:predicted NAD/FAD-binding protein
MNNLQNLKCKTQIFATLNPNMKIDPAKILVQRHYRHPVFDEKAIQAQGRWHELQGLNRTAYCGAYWGWGFHEDGARSAARVVDYLTSYAH